MTSSKSTDLPNHMEKAVLVLIFVDRTSSVKSSGCHDADHDEMNEIARMTSYVNKQTETHLAGVIQTGEI